MRALTKTVRACALWTPVLATVCVPGNAHANDEAAAQPTRILFAPAEGMRLHKSFSLRHQLVVEENLILSGDDPLKQVDNMEMETGFLVRMFDDIKKVDDGRPMVFRRRFEEVRLDALAALPGATETKTDTLFANSPLSGKSVVFTYRPEDAEYGRYYDVEEAAEELLPRLTIDTDFVHLLPEGEVKPGDEWSVDPSAVRDLFGFAGDVELVFSRNINDILLARNLMFGVGGSLWHAFARPPKGSVKVTFKELRQEGDVNVAVLAIVVDLECDIDQTELANDKRNSIELTSGHEVEDAKLQVGLEGDGELLWDMDHHVPHGLTLVCAETVYTARTWKDRDDSTPSLLPTMPSQSVRLLGAVRIDLQTSIGDPPAGNRPR